MKKIFFIKQALINIVLFLNGTSYCMETKNHTDDFEPTLSMYMLASQNSDFLKKRNEFYKKNMHLSADDRARLVSIDLVREDAKYNLLRENIDDEGRSFYKLRLEKSAKKKDDILKSYEYTQPEGSPRQASHELGENKAIYSTSPNEKLAQLETCYQEVQDADKQSKEIASTYKALSALMTELEHDYEEDASQNQATTADEIEVFDDKTVQKDDIFKQGEKHLEDLSQEYDKQQSRYHEYMDHAYGIVKSFDQQLKKNRP